MCALISQTPRPTNGMPKLVIAQLQYSKNKQQIQDLNL